MRLVQQQLVNHCVVVSGSRWFIVDRAESYPLKFMESVLRLCGGDGSVALQVKYAREVVVREE